MSTEVKLLTLLNVSAIKRPRELDAPGGYRSPSVSASGAGSRAQSIDGAEPGTKRRRGVVFGGEIGPSGSTYGKNGKGKGKGKAKAVKVVEVENGDGEVVEETVDAEEEQEDEGEGDDDDEASDDTFNTHFGPEPGILDRVPLVEDGQWTTHGASVPGLGRVVEMRPGDAPPAEGRARVSPTSADDNATRRMLTGPRSFLRSQRGSRRSPRRSSRATSASSGGTRTCTRTRSTARRTARRRRRGDRTARRCVRRRRRTR